MTCQFFESTGILQFLADFGLLFLQAFKCISELYRSSIFLLKWNEDIYVVNIKLRHWWIIIRYLRIYFKNSVIRRPMIMLREKKENAVISDLHNNFFEGVTSTSQIGRQRPLGCGSYKFNSWGLMRINWGFSRNKITIFKKRWLQWLSCRYLLC